MNIYFYLAQHFVINTTFKDIESMIKKDIKNILRPQEERETASVLASTASKGDYTFYIKTEPDKYGDSPKCF